MMEVATLSGETLSHDHAIAQHLAKVLSGGEKAGASPVTEDDIFELEKLNFIELCKMPATAARIDAMLKTGKPLRN